MNGEDIKGVEIQMEGKNRSLSMGAWSPRGTAKL